MTARGLALLGLAILLGLFALDRGEAITWASVVCGDALALRFWIWPRLRGDALSEQVRRSLNGALVGVLWLGCLAILATDWLPADTFLPIALLGGVWFILDKPSGRHLDTMLVAVVCVAAWVVLNVVSLPEATILPAAGVLGLLILIALSKLDRARVVEVLGDPRAKGRIRLDPLALLLLLAVTVPMAWVLPLPTAMIDERFEWSQNLDRIVGFTESVDLTRLGLLKNNDNGALNVTVWDVKKDRNGLQGWTTVSQWTEDDEANPDRHPLLLRGAALGRWNGETFVALENPQPDPDRRTRDRRLGFALVRQEIELGPHGRHTLFSLERPIGGSENVRLTGGALRAIDPVVVKTEYTVVSEILPPTQRSLLRGKGASHRDRRYLGLANVSDEVRKKAAELARMAPSNDPYDLAVFIENWFASRSDGGGFTYSRFNRNGVVDPIETFLFDTQSGHCAFFAASMVLMLRSLDIPARLAVGFRGGTWSDRADAFRVLQKNAHAWVEVPFNGAGWVYFDPTPPESRLDLENREGAEDEDPGGGQLAPLLDDPADERELPGGAILLALLGGGLVLLGAWILRRRVARTATSGLRGTEAGLYARVVRIATKGGASRRRSATLRELVREAAALPADALPGLQRVVAWLYRARYGARPLLAEESLEAGRILDSVERGLRS